MNKYLGMLNQVCFLSFIVIALFLVNHAECGRGSTKQIYKKLLEVDANLSKKIDFMTSFLIDREKKQSTTCPVQCPPVCQPNEMCLNLDTTGDITGNIPGITIHSPMTSLKDQKPCSRQIVLKAHFLRDTSITDVCLPSKSLTSRSLLPPQRMLKIQMFLSSGARSNYLFNIGDSYTNNGHAGDAGSQTYDSEVHGRNNDIDVYGNDNCHGISSKHLYTLNKPASLVNAWVKNRYLKLSNDNGLLFSNCTECLFALGGQTDQEGPENEDIFISANRVISLSPSDRTGYGLCFMKLRWVAGSFE